MIQMHHRITAAAHRVVNTSEMSSTKVVLGRLLEVVVGITQIIVSTNKKTYIVCYLSLVLKS